MRPVVWSTVSPTPLMTFEASSFAPIVIETSAIAWPHFGGDVRYTQDFRIRFEDHRRQHSVPLPKSIGGECLRDLDRLPHVVSFLVSPDL
jgi:hypothetical protein